MPDLRVNRARGGADRLLDIGNDLDRVVIPVFMSDQKQIADAVADLLLVTHEHGDHNAVQVIADVKQTVRSSAGTVDTQVWHSVESDRMLWDYESSADGHAWSSTWHIAYRRAE